MTQATEMQVDWPGARTNGLTITVAGTPHGRPRSRFGARKINGKWTARPFKITKIKIGKDGEPTPDSKAWVRANEWYAAVQAAVLPLLAGADAPWTGPIGVTIDVYMERPATRPKYRTKTPTGVVVSEVPREVWDSGAAVRCITKPDRDNADKAILDAITEAGLWLDDRQVCDGPVRKWYAARGRVPGVVIVAIRLDWIAETAGALKFTKGGD